MDKQAVRITLRLSEKLHALLTKYAEPFDRPLNTEIIRRLESTFDEYSDELLDNTRKSLTNEQEARIRELIREELEHKTKG